MAGMWITRLGVEPHEKGEEAQLRRGIWSSLPDDIFDSVVARLPLRSFFSRLGIIRSGAQSAASFSFLVPQFRELGGATIRAVVCSAICDGILYCLTARHYQLHAFNVVTEEWIPLRIRLPEEVSAPSLVARHGRLFLVGAFRYNYHEKSHNIWELDFDTERWHGVDILLEAAAGSNHGRIHGPPESPRPCKQSRRVVDDDVILFVKWCTRVLAYNVSKKSWLWLPVCVPSAHGSHPFHNGLFFSPSLFLP